MKETKLKAKESPALPPVPTQLSRRGGKRSGKQPFHKQEGEPKEKKKNEAEGTVCVPCPYIHVEGREGKAGALTEAPHEPTHTDPAESS